MVAPASGAADRWLARPNNIRLRYRDQGDGPAVVLVHGWALDLELWDKQTVELVSRYRVLRWDRRGFGLSTGAPSIAEDAADLVALLDAASVRRAAVVGMSQGARVAVQVARAVPNRIACLVLDGAPPGVAGKDFARTERSRSEDGVPEVPLSELRRVLAECGIAALHQALSQLALLRLVTPDPRVHADLRAIIGRYSGNDLRAPEEASPELADNQRETFADTRQPTLLLNGALDSAQRHAASEAITRTTPDVERVVLPRAGHLANLDNPAQYTAVVSEFFSQASSRMRVGSHRSI